MTAHLTTNFSTYWVESSEMDLVEAIREVLYPFCQTASISVKRLYLPDYPQVVFQVYVLDHPEMTFETYLDGVDVMQIQDSEDLLEWMLKAFKEHLDLIYTVPEGNIVLGDE